MPFTTKIVVTAPQEYTVNSVGKLTEETTNGDWTTWTWESDYPVKLVNIVAGKWDVKREAGTALFYHPEHTYNVDEMSETLVAARKYFSEWFYPYPWSELKVSQFPNMAGYAQGFPTNITFSEGIGFLTDSDETSGAAFLVTAHETAHQWWGNLVTPGNGPGGNILSEGMAHYSTILLHEQVKGEQARIAFCKLIEESYTDSRRVDGERPLTKIDGARGGDGTVTYDKGGWVMWMLHNLMGREAALEGLQEFQRRYIPGPDHPLLEDLIATLREYAPDVETFDAFTQQWFFDVVVPHYQLSEATMTESGAMRTVSFTIKNAGTGTATVEVAAFRGERFPDEDDEDAETYEEARTGVTLGPGETQMLKIEAGFVPEQLVVDPDALVLQLFRDKAIFDLGDA